MVAYDYDYTLIYWPEIPGRGEYIRLAFEATGKSYQEESDIKALRAHSLSTEKVGSPPHFAPPILKIEATERSEKDSEFNETVSKVLKTKEGQSASSNKSKIWYLSQTPAILNYLSQELGLNGDKNSNQSSLDREIEIAHVNQLVLTILDLSNEIHDVHHPIDVSLTYEEQIPESKRKSKFLRNLRIPKFFKLFQLTISQNPNQSGFLIGNGITISDLTLFQVLEGIQFSFPKLWKSLNESKRFDQVFQLREKVMESEGIEKYLKSGRRREFSMGLFRYYEELDGEVEFND